MIFVLNLLARCLGRLTLGLLSAGLVTACAMHEHPNSGNTSSSFGLHGEQTGLFVSAAFAPDGRLWRVSASKQHVFVDFSIDNGKTFSVPVTVSRESQRIKSSIENRPSIAVGASNQIFVIYPAEGRQPAGLFFSVSTDGGQNFANPVPLSDKADEANTLQASIAVSTQGKPYIFWHDDRDRIDYKQVGNSVYYTTVEANDHLAVSQKAADVLCECCRLSIAFDIDNEPVVFGRFVYDGGARDHGLLKADHGSWRSWRVTNDEWRIEACPEQGPVISIANNGDYHLAWLTQGQNRKGLFYAKSSDHGQHFSQPMPIGNLLKLPNHPAVLSQGKHVALAWNEFDGEKTQLLAMQSNDAGQTWSVTKSVEESASAVDRPVFLLKPNSDVFLSWNTKKEGFKLFKFEWQK